MPTRARIFSNQALDDKIYRMVLEAPKIAQTCRPGQFVNLYCDDKSRLLPRPISICDADQKEGTLTLIFAVVGQGTEEFAGKKAGDTIRVLGPLGNGYDLKTAQGADRILVMGGGLGMPPMLFLARKLNAPQKTDIYLGFRSQPWMGQEFRSFGTVYESSDDGACGFKGTVLDKMRKVETAPSVEIAPSVETETAPSEEPAPLTGKTVVYACGPKPMLKALQQEFAADDKVDCYFSLEERMGCGIGACAGCPALLRMPDGSIERHGVCKEGPIFNGKQVIFE